MFSHISSRGGLSDVLVVALGPGCAGAGRARRGAVRVTRHSVPTAKEQRREPLLHGTLVNMRKLSELLGSNNADVNLQ